MREDEKQGLIEHCKFMISEHIKYGGYSDDEQVYRIALAALAAEPVAIVEPRDYVTAAQIVGDEPLSKSVRPLFEGALAMGQKLYSASPVTPPAPSVPTEPVSRGYTSPDGFVMVPRGLLESLHDAARFEKASYAASFGSHIDVGRWKDEYEDLSETCTAVSKLLEAAPQPGCDDA